METDSIAMLEKYAREALKRMMRDYSEAHHAAGWTSNLTEIVWENRASFEDAREIIGLANVLSGTWRWKDGEGPEWVTLQEAGWVESAAAVVDEGEAQRERNREFYAVLVKIASELGEWPAGDLVYMMRAVPKLAADVKCERDNANVDLASVKMLLSHAKADLRDARAELRVVEVERDEARARVRWYDNGGGLGPTVPAHDAPIWREYESAHEVFAAMAPLPPAWLGAISREWERAQDMLAEARIERAALREVAKACVVYFDAAVNVTYVQIKFATVISRTTATKLVEHGATETLAGDASEKASDR